MGFSTRFLIILVCVLSSFSIQASDSQPAAVVQGTVVNKLSGRPVKSAHVIYNRIVSETGGTSSPISTDTDAEGNFSFSLAPGTYRFWVEHSGFARQVYGALSPAGEGTTLTVAAGQKLSQITFRLVPQGAIAGRIVDEDGDPIQSAGIQVLRFSYANDHRQLVSVSGASSNDRGEYRIFGLPAGRYLLQATVPNTPMSKPYESGALVPEVQDSYAASYYPGVIDVDAASPVSLGEGGDLEDINFQVRKVRTVSLRGRLASPEKPSSSQIQVVLAHNENGVASYIDRASASVDSATGRFEVRGVAPGSYLLVASQLSAGRPLGGRIPVELTAASRDEITLPLASAVDVTGTVELEGTARGSVPNLILRLASSEGLALGPQPLSKIGADGTIHFAGVTPGRWTVTFDSLPEGLWIKSESFAGVDLPAGELNLTESTRGQLHIVLGSNGAQISGTVSLDNQPCRATVVLAPADPELRTAHQMYKVTNTTERGLFTLKSVRPGSYKLFAFQEIEPFEWFNPDKLKLAEDMGSPVTVSAGESAMHDIVAIPPDLLLFH